MAAGHYSRQIICPLAVLCGLQTQGLVISLSDLSQGIKMLTVTPPILPRRLFLPHPIPRAHKQLKPHRGPWILVTDRLCWSQLQTLWFPAMLPSTCPAPGLHPPLPGLLHSLTPIPPPAPISGEPSPPTPTAPGPSADRSPEAGPVWGSLPTHGPAWPQWPPQRLPFQCRPLWNVSAPQEPLPLAESTFQA